MRFQGANSLIFVTEGFSSTLVNCLEMEMAPLQYTVSQRCKLQSISDACYKPQRCMLQPHQRWMLQSLCDACYIPSLDDNPPAMQATMQATMQAKIQATPRRKSLSDGSYHPGYPGYNPSAMYATIHQRYILLYYL